MLVDFRRLLPCAERFYVFSALLPANMQAALSGRKARPKWIDEANAGYLITSCMLVARGGRHVGFRHRYDFAMSSYILRNRLGIIGG
jgi:hypothetical protein